MEIKTSDSPVPYPEALAFMEKRVEAIGAGQAGDLLWLLEHPPVYTAGTSAKEADLLSDRFPVFRTGRGGQYTYHGPGQRVSYLMINLKNKQQSPDIKKYIWQIEEWVIRALDALGVSAERREGRVGLWVASPAGEEKIAAIGVRVRRWVAYHGVSINVDPDLSHFGGIVPCGLGGYGVTSLKKLGIRAGMADLDRELLRARDGVFGTGPVFIGRDAPRCVNSAHDGK